MRLVRWTFTERCMEINVSSPSFKGKVLYSRISKLRYILGGPAHAAEYFSRKINAALHEVGEHELTMTDLRILSASCADAHRELKRFGNQS